MNRIGGRLLTPGAMVLAMLAVPAALQAQRKPSNSMHTRSADVYLERAKGTSREEDRIDLLNKALEALEPARQQDADNPRVWLLIGQAQARLGNAAAADSAFDKAESLWPEYTKEIEPERLTLWVNLYNRGVGAVQEGRYDEALTLLESADRIYRGRPEAVLSLGSLYVQQGNLAKAEAAFRAALEITQGPAAANVQEADRARWAEQEKTAASRLARLLDQLGRRDDAVAVHRSYVEKHPDDNGAKAELAAALAKAGKADEAAAIYEQLMTGADLTDIEWFNAGVGLYGAERFDMAAKAFRKSIEKNPYSRDAYYNLGQTLYAASSELEEQRAAAAEPQKAELNQKLQTLMNELIQVSDKIREFDPNFRNALMMKAHAQRTLGDVAADTAAKKEWQDKVVATLGEAEKMSFEVSNVAVRAGEGTVTVSGRVTNLNLPAGQSITLTFTLLSETGATIATVPVSVTAAEANAGTEFNVEAKTESPVAGWKYTTG